MKIEFHCGECDGYIASEDSFRGEIIRCPSCGREVVVPLTSVGPGVVVAGFKILRKIGVGGMGSVYLAEQTRMSRQVALKVLPAAFTRDQVFLDRFMKEIRLQGSLSHPQIATAYDAGTYNDICYLAMEYVEGPDLYDVIAENKQIEERTALRIMRKAAAGLAYAWTKQRLIHRDIKPSNIMIAPGGEVKILDLGISKTLTRSGETRHPTDESVIGTPHYMSPEQARESSSVDLRSDIYSLGATLYHMVTGQVPFPGENLVAVVTRQVSGPALAPQSLNPEISEPCAHLLEVMMARDVSERYGTWDECMADMGRVLSGHHPIAPHPVVHGSMVEPSPLRQRAHQEKKQVRSAVPWVAGLTVLLTALLVWGVMTSRPRSAPVPKPARSLPDRIGAANPAEDIPRPAPTVDSTVREELEARRALLDQERTHDDGSRNLLYDYRTLAQDAWAQGETEIAERVLTQLAELRDLRASAARAALEALDTQVQPLLDRGALLEAADVLRSYDGPHASHTLRTRLTRAHALSATARETAVIEWRDLQHQIVTEILTNASPDTAVPLLVRARTQPLLEPVRDLVSDLEWELENVSRVPADVMGTFHGDVGREILVPFTLGPKRLLINRIGHHTVTGTLNAPHGPQTFTFGYRDLAFQEKVRRLARTDTPAAQFMLGILALEAGEPDHALTSFRRSGGRLSNALADSLTESTSGSHAANPLE